MTLEFRDSVRGLKNQNGLSLIEVLLSIAVFSALVFAGVGWMHLLNKEAGSSNENAAIANAMTQIKYAFGDDDRYCRNILGILPGTTQPRPFNVNLGEGQRIDSIDYYDLTNNARISNVVTIGQSVGTNSGLIMRDIRLRPISNLSPTTVLTSLEFLFAKSGHNTGPQEILRRLPIYVTMDATGRIKKCSTTISTTLVQSRICEVSNDGYERWNPLTEKCELIEGVYWHSSGSSTVAECPAPDLVAVSGMEPEPAQIACKTDATDGPSIPPRTYLSGHEETSNSIGWSATVDLTTNRCAFVYVTGSVPIAMAAQIKCYKTGTVQR